MTDQTEATDTSAGAPGADSIAAAIARVSLWHAARTAAAGEPRACGSVDGHRPGELHLAAADIGVVLAELSDLYITQVEAVDAELTVAFGQSPPCAVRIGAWLRAYDSDAKHACRLVVKQAATAACGPHLAVADIRDLHALNEAYRRRLAAEQAETREADMLRVARGELPDEQASALIAHVDAEREADIRAAITGALEEEQHRVRLRDGVDSGSHAAFERAIEIARGEDG